MFSRITVLLAALAVVAAAAIVGCEKKKKAEQGAAQQGATLQDSGSLTGRSDVGTTDREAEPEKHAAARMGEGRGAPPASVEAEQEAKPTDKSAPDAEAEPSSEDEPVEDEHVEY